MPTDYLVEQRFFDRVASRTEPKPIQEHVLQRYAAPRWPQLFSKEKMFSLAGQLRGKRLLEVGCGEGVVSVQLAHCGARVQGVDLSPRSIEVARRRAALQGVEAQFEVMNVVEEQITRGSVLRHHLVRPDLASPGGFARCRHGPDSPRPPSGWDVHRPRTRRLCGLAPRSPFSGPRPC